MLLYTNSKIASLGNCQNYFSKALTLHNIPEGLAIGVACGAVAANLPSASLAGAVALAIGIGIQNFPEGAAVDVALG